MWQCRVAPSLGDLEGTPTEVWKTSTYTGNSEEGLANPTVFFGLYGLNDFYSLWRHKGQKAVLWAGSDIRHLQKGYWLEDIPDGLNLLGDIPHWINKYCDNYCENEVEYDVLKDMGIESSVVPSFMGNVDDYEVSFKQGNKVYASVSGNDFELYGWDKINEIAELNPAIEFHMYGNTEPWKGPENMIVHGRVPKEQMNKEIKDMQGCIRMAEFDGFSEIVAKALLWGQYPISVIDYPTTLKPTDTRMIKWKEEPNLEGREWLLANVNKYPWNKK